MHDGFAIRRNGTCLTQETQCGLTVQPFYACCPQGMYCANPYNQVCCDTKGVNCTSSVLKQPTCAETTETLYNNGGVDSGYFCCSNSTFGFGVNSTGSDGCGDPGYQLIPGEVSLQPLIQAAASTLSTTVSSTSPTATSASLTAALSTASPSTVQSSIHGNHSNTGVIAGAVVGGILGLLLVISLVIWMIKRRHNNRISSTNDPSNDTFKITTYPKYSKVTGSDSRGYHLGRLNTSEADGQPVSELPPEKDGRYPPRRPVELP